MLTLGDLRRLTSHLDDTVEVSARGAEVNFMYYQPGRVPGEAGTVVLDEEPLEPSDVPVVRLFGAQGESDAEG